MSENRVLLPVGGLRLGSSIVLSIGADRIKVGVSHSLLSSQAFLSKS